MFTNEKDIADVFAKMSSPGPARLAIFSLLVIVILCSVLWERQLSKEAEGWVRHTMAVKVELSNLLSTITDAETGQRGYLLTADEAYLEPYESAIASVSDTVSNLARLTSDNPRQQERLEQVESLIELKLNEIWATVLLRRERGLDAALFVVESDEGRQLMDELREEVRQMHAIEDALMAALLRRTVLLERFGAFGALVALFALVSLAVSTVRGLSRNLRDLQRAHSRIAETNAELEEFAYRTSHDLLSPLVSSIGLLGVAKEAMEDGETDVVGASLDHATRSLRKLEALVGDLVQLTRIDHEEEATVPVDVVAVIESTLEDFRYMDGFERIDIVCDLRVAGPLSTKASRFVLIVENLISNAIKYKDPAVERPFVKIAAFERGSSFVLDVRDNGLGIPETQQGSLFQMFKRFHPKTAFGSGLGLYMVKKSAAHIGAELTFEDTGEGSAFRLEIPRTA